MQSDAAREKAPAADNTPAAEVSQSASLPPIMADPPWVFEDRSTGEGHTPAPRVSMLKLLAGSNDRTAKPTVVTSQPDAQRVTQDRPGRARGPEEQGWLGRNHPGRWRPL